MNQTPNLDNLVIFQPINAPIILEDIKVLYGANYFSGGPVVRLRINLAAYDEVLSNKIEGFYDKLKELVPSLYSHHCSVGTLGGFFKRVEEGTLLGHILEHTAIEFQNLAKMDVGFGKTRMTKKQGVYNVVFRFEDEIAGCYAGKAALSLINSILLNLHFDVNKVIENLIFIREKRVLGFSTKAIVKEAIDRKIPYQRLDEYNRIQLGTGKYKKIIRATITGDTSLIAVETVDNKFLTAKILGESGIPVPQRIITQDVESALQFFNQIKKPIVIKPATGYQGKRVSINLNSEEAIRNAFEWTKEFDDDVIVQEYISGNIYRLLIIDYKLVGAVQLQPPFIIGNGESTINELIDLLNNEAIREVGDKGMLSKVQIDEETLKIIELLGFNLNTVLPEKELIYLKNSGNLIQGALSADVTDVVHPFNRFIGEHVSKILNLDVAGIDILAPSLQVPITETNGKIIEVNAAPDFRMHINPILGEKRTVQKQFIDMLFPKGNKTRVPLISITGSKGKRLTLEILNYWLQSTGLQTGVVSSKGLFVGKMCLKKGDMTNSENVQLILRDPSIDIAIVETPVETILKQGLAYKFADIGIVLNLLEEKLEYYDYDHIVDIVDIAYAKSVVAEEVYDDGFTILNADNELIVEMQERLYSKPILFSKTNSEWVKQFIIAGGTAAVVEDEVIYIYKQLVKTEIAKISEIIMLGESNEEHLLDCILAAILVMIVKQEKNEVISNFIKTISLSNLK